MSRTTDRGFTIVEVLAALATAAMILAAVANLSHGAARSGARTSTRLAEIALARALLAYPADRAAAGDLRSGETVDGLRWRVAVGPSSDAAASESTGGGWRSALVSVDIQSAGGAVWRVEAIRLVKASAK